MGRTVLSDETAAPQLRTYLISNLILATDTPCPREVFGGQMLVMEEMLNLGIRYPELAAKIYDDLRRNSNDPPTDVQMDMMANFDENDVRIAAHEYRMKLGG